MLTAKTMPGVTVTPTRRTVLFRLRRRLALLWCWYEIRELSSWTKACEADGIVDTDHMRGCRARLEHLRTAQTVWRNS